MPDESELIFVSHAERDDQWAQWAAWHLEQAGYRVELGLWHWRAGDDFVTRMNEALEQASAVVAVLSPHYFEPGRYTEEQWRAAVARGGRFIPVVVEPLKPGQLPAFLSSRIQVDLHELPGEAEAVKALTEAVRGRGRPEHPPAYPPAAAPGPQPRFPATASAAAVVWEVRRRRNPHFTGRDEVIGELRGKLLAERHAAVQALHGTGGIGKTQVALEYVYRFREHYDIVWWIDAEQADQIPVHYAELAARVGVAKPDAGVEFNARYALDELRSRERWLIVLDNAEEPERLETWLPDGPGHVLITSRNPGWKQIVPGLPLGVFSRAESLDHLRGHLPTLATEDAEALAEALGDLPLALAQAAGALGDGMPPDRYLEVLRTDTAQLLDHDKAHDYRSTLTATVTIAMDRLEADHPGATAVLRLAALLGPEPIPTAWLVAARDRLATVPGDTGDFRWPRPALQPLARYGLAVVSPDAFQVHRLTQAVVREGLDPDRRDALWDDVVSLLTAADPGDSELPESWPRWSALAPHLTAGMTVLCRRAAIRPLLLSAARYLVRSAQWRAARDFAAGLHASWSGHLGENHVDTLHAASMETWAMEGLGHDPDMLPRVRDILERRRATLGEDHPDTLDSTYDLATALHGIGRYAEALALHQDVGERRARVLGEDAPDTLRSVQSMARALTVLGRFDEGLRVTFDALGRYRATLGEEHPDTLRSLRDAAASLSYVGRYKDAYRTAHEAYERIRAVMGDNHPETLSAAHGLTMAMTALERHTDAQDLIMDTLRRLRRDYGESHPNALELTTSLGLVLARCGRPEDAHELLTDTMEQHLRVYGPDHPGALQCALGIGLTLHGTGRNAEAERYLRDLRRRVHRVLGGENVIADNTTRALAIALAAQGKHREAHKLIAYVQRRAPLKLPVQRRSATRKGRR
ncbi:FxSxx-COOH system tetratricopeptide repeat protein [Streptomyces glaucescens]|uniref:ATP/GTP binding protein n=1 Tax=Streptomyces glaucescens TaxID=1907 RepID=A0A089XB33_STRGA|nr:FxSxx-COOH system tetratricopeptide repeat protein [Streptomyces glaucescens]AIR99126.1 ATP/GTP binding protein [Streptomyces glaucescens]